MVSCSRLDLATCALEVNSQILNPLSDGYSEKIKNKNSLLIVIYLMANDHGVNKIWDVIQRRKKKIASHIYIKKRWSVNYFANLGVECHFFKLGCNESNFLKRRGHQCNLPKKKKSTVLIFIRKIDIRTSCHLKASPTIFFPFHLA